MPTNLSKTPQEVDHENLTALSCMLTVDFWNYKPEETESCISFEKER